VEEQQLTGKMEDWLGQTESLVLHKRGAACVLPGPVKGASPPVDIFIHHSSAQDPFPPREEGEESLVKPPKLTFGVSNKDLQVSATLTQNLVHGALPRSDQEHKHCHLIKAGKVPADDKVLPPYRAGWAEAQPTMNRSRTQLSENIKRKRKMLSARSLCLNCGTGIHNTKHPMESYKNPRSGPPRLADTLEVERTGPRHQAGSDSLLTGRAFFATTETYFKDANKDEMQECLRGDDIRPRESFHVDRLRLLHYMQVYEMAGRLTENKAALHGCPGIAMLRPECKGQAICINCLLRKPLHHNLYDRAPNDERARHHYRLGRIKNMELSYAKNRDSPYVKNLDSTTDDERLKKEFTPHETITSANVTGEKGRSEGHGFAHRFVYTPSPDNGDGRGWHRAYDRLHCTQEYKDEYWQECSQATTGRNIEAKPLCAMFAQRKKDRKPRTTEIPET
jgi:hypothetical protein